MHICEVALEESAWTLILPDLGPAVHCALVHLLLLPAHHHEPPAHRVEGLRHCHRTSCHHLGNSKSEENAWLFSCKLFGCVIGSKVDGPVDDDSLHRAEESRVETFHHTISFEAFANAVHQALVLSLCSTLANISSQPGPGKVERVNNGKAGRPSSSPARQVGSEELPKLIRGDRIWSRSHKNCLELVFEGEVERLCGEVSDHVHHISSPERKEALLILDSGETVHHPLVLVSSSNSLVCILNLEQQLDPLQWSHHRLTHCSRHTACNKV